MGITGDWDRTITRRTLLRTGGSFAASVTIMGAIGTRAFATPPFDGNPFTLGIASGDPTPNSVVLWTRLAPEPLIAGRRDEERALSRPLRARARRRIQPHRPPRRRRGGARRGPQRPRRAGRPRPGARSTSTASSAGREISPRRPDADRAGARQRRSTSSRFAFVSCQNFPAGFFNAYARRGGSDDLDAVIHLGDYIYEGPARDVPRARAAERDLLARRLPDPPRRSTRPTSDLQAAHAALPWLVTWDDHEVENNYADLDSDPDSPVEEFTARRADAYRAYWEHMPLRRARKPTGAFFDLFRRFRWGDLATFNVLDTRQYRSDQAEPVCTPGAAAGERLLPRRARARPHDARRRSSATGCSRTSPPRRRAGTCSPTRPRSHRSTRPTRPAATSGRATTGTATSPSARCCSTGSSRAARRTRSSSPATRTRTGSATCRPTTVKLRRAARRHGVHGHVDLHRRRRGAVRPVRTTPDNPHIFFRNNNRGYVRCTLTPDTWTSDFRIVGTVRERESPGTTLATFAVENGKAGAHRIGV